MNSNTNTLIESFKYYWHQSSTIPNGEFQSQIESWRRFHLEKALMFIVIFIVLLWLSIYLWKKYCTIEYPLTGKSKFLSVLDIFTSLGTFLAWIIVIANIQGILYPFSSLMTRIIPAADGQTKQILHSIRLQISNEKLTPKANYLLNDFGNYHLVIAILGLLTFAILLFIIMRIWKTNQLKQLSTLQQVVVITIISILVLQLLTLIILTIANFSTYFDPKNALISALKGDF